MLPHRNAGAHSQELVLLEAAVPPGTAIHDNAHGAAGIDVETVFVHLHLGDLESTVAMTAPTLEPVVLRLKVVGVYSC